MKQIVLPLLACLQAGQVLAQTLEYPATRQTAVVDTFYQKNIITDNYRWLEDLRSIETNKWVESQNSVSKKFLAKASNKTNAFLGFDKYSYVRTTNNFVKDGNYYFRYYYYNTTGSSGLYYKSTMSDNPTLDNVSPLVDPKDISATDRINLKGYKVSQSSDLLAYQFSRNGSDWAEIKVVELKSGRHRPDHLRFVKFSNIAWKGNGFFYAAYPKAGEGQKVYYHELGTEQTQDKLIFERNSAYYMFDFSTTADGRYFVLREEHQVTGTESTFIIDYSSETPVLKPLLANLAFTFKVQNSRNGKLLAYTTHNAPNGRLVEVDPANPFNWREIIPQFSKALLTETYLMEDRIVATFLVKGHPLLTVFDYTGKMLYNLELPVATSVHNFSGAPNKDEVYYRYNAYTFPSVVYKFNTKTFERTLTERTTVSYDIDNFEYKEVEYPGKDGTLIPMTLIYEKGLRLEGGNPTLLKAYGGFGVISTPHFDPGIIHFVKKGGVFAFASIRGGGELGQEWARQGRGANKQTSFDDFNAAAEYLIQAGYTNPARLAATGASNGGLVVAAAAIQRPDLYKAVVPVAAPLDMLRFEKFTVGALHVDEYGTTQDSLSFQKLREYSPLHNIKPTVNYPAMLLMASSNDDRVPPFHSYKFVAALQNRPAQKNPVILRTEQDAGHYGATGLYSMVREEADLYAFVMQLLSEDQ
ncbi:prolyl oligopeptidase [Pontibacter ummariensis]|uniref:prolyl oligopeptidase n=1 Tax=Pontibacter ummariensis TaxID=1610492 RepID=A0A239EBT3_9BACT|nr:prolyl oligopeptidase family serine peptidase [Pontibacter ummariensis]PRY13174.1 prolyl oligopeptidase [Pontibacter ummariensis]SNS41931.1 prolyl oligopeptidase [Pontibacter ummariensis]